MAKSKPAKSTPSKKGFWRKAWHVFKRVFLFLFIFHLVYLIALRWVNPPITITQLVSWVTGHGLKRDYVDRSDISPYAGLAVISSEDQLFPDHNGFDWKSIEKAMAYNKRKPGRTRGASTISQQVAKNVFLWQHGGWFRKGLEVYFTFMIELLWNKERILEVYLNVIEMGDGVFGIEAASQKYFNHSARTLNRQEAALIAACLPNPKRLIVKPASGYMMSRSQAIMKQMSFLEPDPDIQRVTGLARGK